MIGRSRAAIGSGTAAASLREGDLSAATTPTIQGIDRAAASPADLAGTGLGTATGSPATGARALRQPGDHERMTLRLFLTV